MFGKPSSITLLNSADKSDAVAQRAFALAQAAQTKADKARELAGVAEAKECVIELSQAEVAARLILATTSATHTAAIADRNLFRARYEASKKTVEATQNGLITAEKNLAIAQRAVNAERSRLKTME